MIHQVQIHQKIFLLALDGQEKSFDEFDRKFC
jgi:hypothetical protein